MTETEVVRDQKTILRSIISDDQPVENDHLSDALLYYRVRGELNRHRLQHEVEEKDRLDRVELISVKNRAVSPLGVKKYQKVTQLFQRQSRRFSTHPMYSAKQKEAAEEVERIRLQELQNAGLIENRAPSSQGNYKKR